MYYEVYVSEPRYQKAATLTYSGQDNLEIGSIVEVPYGKKTVSGFVVKQVPKPSFATKPISSVLDLPPMPDDSTRLLNWVSEYYSAGSGSVTQLLLPSGLNVKRRISKDKPNPKQQIDSPPLTPEQASVVARVQTKNQGSFILHGETGSGKTRVYIELAKQAASEGKSSIVLTPEISLVPQLAHSFEQLMGPVVIQIHSGLTKAQRNKNWIKVLTASSPIVVVGTRSALFAPLRNIGFIAIDEMHEPAYKQDSAPRYHALRAAAIRAHMSKAVIVYGSATPSVADYFISEQNNIPVLRMEQTAKASDKPEYQIVDLKDKSNFSLSSNISDQLIEAVRANLISKQQSLLFLNRRGTARQILCQDCGWQALCPKCDLPLTFHSDTHTVKCHVCSYSASPPLSCPDCNSSDILYRSIGTKSLVDTLHRIFPEARIQRFDTDNLASEHISRHYDSIRSGEVDIIVGTQMLGKGLDLPKLSLVGIINADTSLSMPDYSSAERSYQLLHQAIGRVGRGHIRGKVIVQSFNPNDYLLRAAATQDWRSMYEHELSQRKMFRFPPFCFLLKISVSRSTQKSAEDYTLKLHKHITSQRLGVEVQDPSPSFYERTHGKYNWQIVIKSHDRKLLLRLIESLPNGDYSFDLDPLNLL